MFIQFLIALLLGLACPSHQTTHADSGTTVTTNSVNDETVDGPGGGSTGGEGGQIDPPK